MSPESEGIETGKDTLLCEFTDTALKVFPQRFWETPHDYNRILFFLPFHILSSPAQRPHSFPSTLIIILCDTTHFSGLFHCTQIGLELLGFRCLDWGFTLMRCQNRKGVCFIFILIATHSSNPCPHIDPSEKMIISFPAS